MNVTCSPDEVWKLLLSAYVIESAGNGEEPWYWIEKRREEVDPDGTLIRSEDDVRTIDCDLTSRHRLNEGSDDFSDRLGSYREDFFKAIVDNSAHSSVTFDVEVSMGRFGIEVSTTRRSYGV